LFIEHVYGGIYIYNELILTYLVKNIHLLLR
jgi:hypothetical protein